MFVRVVWECLLLTLLIELMMCVVTSCFDVLDYFVPHIFKYNNVQVCNNAH